MNGAHSLTNQSVAPYLTLIRVEDALDFLAAELTLQETGGTLTSTAAEQTLYIDNAPVGCFEPRVLFCDLDLMAAGGDQITFRVYYRIADGAALLLHDVQVYTGVNGGLANSITLIVIDLYPNRFGVRVSLQRTGGADYDFPWAVMVEGGP